MRVFLATILLVLMILSTLSIANSRREPPTQQQFEHEFVKLHKKTTAELCQLGCQTEITDIWILYTEKFFSEDKNAKRLNSEQVRCYKKCEELK